MIDPDSRRRNQAALSQLDGIRARRILFWTDLFWPYIGGGEIFGSKLILALRDQGYEFAVLTSHDYLDLPDEADYHGIPVCRLPFRDVLRGKKIAQLAALTQRVTRLKQTYQPDLIHVNSVSPSVLFHLRTSKAQPTPTLLRMNQQALANRVDGQNTLTVQTLHRADWICCVSTSLLTEVNQLVPETRNRSSVIHNGLEIPPILPEPLPTQAPCLLLLGRLVPAKGFDLALTALASIIRDRPNVRMIIAGDGAARSELQQQATALGLSRIAKFIGWVDPDRVPALINQATLVIMPSWREGLPSVALQAAMMARPIVATRSGGVEDVIIHQETGLLVEKGDIQGLAEAIKCLLNNPHHAVRMGMAGRTRVQDLFRWKRCVAAYDTLYTRLIVGSKVQKMH